MNLFGKIAFILGIFGAVEAQAVNIAVVAPKVGPLAKFGMDLVEGAQIAVDLINDDGGIAGEKINLITVDDRCEDSFAVSTAQMMVLNSSPEDKTSMVIGPYCDNRFEQVSGIYADGQIIRIMPMPLDSEQSKIDKPGLFKIGGLMKEEAWSFFDFYKRRLANKNIAVIYDSLLPKTAEAALAVQALFVDNGLDNRIILYDFANYNKNYGQMAKEVLLNSETIYILGGAKPTARLAEALQDEKENAKIIVDEYLATGYFFREMGNFAEGVYVLAMESLKDSPDFTEELVALRLKGKEPKGLGVYGYAAVRLWAQMAEKAESTAFEKVNAAGRSGGFKMPWGEIKFTQGNASKSSAHSVYQIRNGEYAQVE